MKKQKVIVPSILSANFAHLQEDIRRVESAGATMLHLDIMDGHFVPNISFGPAIVKTIDSFSSLLLDVHLMIEQPERYLESFKKAGADIITVHVETCKHLHKTISTIKELGAKAGVSLNPATPLTAIEEILSFADLILVMSVNPGFGGQQYIVSSTEKIRQLVNMIHTKHLNTIVEVDGGIDATTITAASNAGANYFVAGNSIFSNGNIETNYKQLEQSIKNTL